MYFLLIAIPIISNIFFILFSRYIGKFYISILSISSIFLSWLISIFIFYEVVLNNYLCNIVIFQWVNSGLLKFNIGLYYDSLSSTMILMVLTISLLVHIFSIEYMGEDPHFIRFLFLLTLFTNFMLIFILSDNFIQIFFGWEGIGLSSYLLINFWFTRVEANRSAMKAIILNRFGDFGLYLSILLIFFSFKTLNFLTIFNSINYFFQFYPYLQFLNLNLNLISIISLLIFIAAAGKSAQLGLHVWLPDAMEGPTPVSALIHAATMVTAGVYLLLRCSPILEYSKNILLIILFFGGLTALISSTIGIVQNDIKKIIAYSTCSQLGYMVFACGCSNYLASFFHLFNHAFFKALLFLGAGAVIHSMSDEQDLRKYGGLINLLPFSYLALLVGSVTLFGFPFLSGFYSKDLIIETSYSLFTINGLFIYWLGSISVFFTSFYSFRLLYLTFLCKNNSYKKVIENLHDSNIFITLSLIVLSIFSLFSGFIFYDFFFGLGSDIFSNSIFININNEINILEFLPLKVKLCPLFFSILGILIGYLYFYYYNFFFKYFFKIRLLYYIYSLFSKKWYFDLIYFNLIIKNFLLYFFNIFFKLVDRGVIELIGPMGIVRLFNQFSKRINFLNSGTLTFYLLLLFFNFFLVSIIFFNLVNFDYILLLLFIFLSSIKINKYLFEKNC